MIATIKDHLGNPVPGEQLNFQIEINRTGGSLNSVSEFFGREWSGNFDLYGGVIFWEMIGLR